MAAPFAREYLNKLKIFVDFASQNPLILNMPQLYFVKRFIEQFGGKIPEGEYQMAKSSQYAFQDVVKDETRVQMVINNDVDEGVGGEMASSKLLLEEPSVATGNIVYLEETRYKRCRNQKTKKIHCKSKKKKSSCAIKKSGVDSVKNKVILQNVNEEKSQNDDDPLCVHVNKSLKSEPLQDNLKTIKRLISSDGNEYEINDNGDVDEDDDKDFEPDCGEKDNDDDADDDDEPLIMIIRRRGRPSKFNNKDDWPNDVMMKAPRSVTCRDICKQKCVERFTEIQRKEICDYFWSLPMDERILYIRTHSRAKRFTRLKRKRERKRGNNCVYFLHTPSKNKTTNAVRVCRSYFEATLCLTHYNIKKALDGYEPEPEEILMKHTTKTMTNGSESKKKSNHYGDRRKDLEGQIEQTLDPVTGNLTIVHVNSMDSNKDVSGITATTATIDDCGKVKKKRIRRNPNQSIVRLPKRIKCAEHCKYKCHIKFTEDQRQQICSTFWTMDYKRRKDFILSRVETRAVETETTPEFRKSNRPPRTYHTRFYLRAGLHGDNVRVCKDFLMATLCISRHFITNALEFADQTTGYYTGGDRRGHHTPGNKISNERIQEIRQHIESYPTWMPNKKSKTRYLHSSLNIKRLYNEYKDKCIAEQKKYVSNNFFYGIFHNHFKLAFLKPMNANTPSKSKCTKKEKKSWNNGLMHLNPNISTYTGEEPGGFWCDAKGLTERLDTIAENVTKSMPNNQILINMPNDLTNNTSITYSAVQKSETIAAALDRSENVVNYSTEYFNSSQSLHTTHNLNSSPTLNATTAFTRSDVFNPSIFEAAHTSTMFRIL